MQFVLAVINWSTTAAWVAAVIAFLYTLVTVWLAIETRRLRIIQYKQSESRVAVHAWRSILVDNSISEFRIENIGASIAYNIHVYPIGEVANNWPVVDGEKRITISFLLPGSYMTCEIKHSFLAIESLRSQPVVRVDWTESPDSAIRKECAYPAQIKHSDIGDISHIPLDEVRYQLSRVVGKLERCQQRR